MKTAAPAPAQTPAPTSATAPAPNAGPDPTPQAAAQRLDLSRSRRLVYLGHDGSVLAAFLDEWPQLRGVWFGPAQAQDAARRFLARQGLDERVRYVAGSTLDETLACDLVVTNALDEAVETTLQLMVSADAGWLPAQGRWLILQRESPHLSSVIGAPLLHRQGLRLVTQWPLHGGVRLLVCAPAHRLLEMLESRVDRAATRGCQA